MPEYHARLSPSASDRWLSCPASVLAVEALPKAEQNSESVYAQEGTTAHALGELEAARHFAIIDDKTYIKRHRAWLKDARALRLSEEQLADMAHHVEGYVELIAERQKLFPMTQVMLEQRMDTGVPTCWGTSDTVLVSPQHVEIIDLKYGVGVPVSARGNSQLRLYALGALDTFGDVLGETEVVRWTVYQPRINSTSTEEGTPAELLAWRDQIVPIALAALEDTGEFGPSEQACRWCPLAGQCRAQVAWATARDFAVEPATLSPQEISEALEMLPAVKAWAAALEVTALAKAYSENIDLPGWKVVISGGQRVITDPALAQETLGSLGFTEDQLVTRKMKGLGDLESLLKTLPKVKPDGATRTRFQVLGDVLPDGVLGRTEGKPSLVHASDPRPAANPNNEAQKEFTP
jgi:hypothetical protein